MKFIRPSLITLATVIACNAVDLNPVWNNATPYAEGALVTYNQRTWKSAAGGNTGIEPGTNLEWWSDDGPSNRWAMFDGLSKTQTKHLGSLTFTLDQINCDALMFINVSARFLSVVMHKDGMLVYESGQIDLWDTSLIGDWDDYLWNEPEFRSEYALLGLPKVSNMTVTVTLEAPEGSEVALGMVIAGRELNVGLEEFGLRRSGRDLSEPTFEFGELVTPEDSVYQKEFRSRVELENERLDLVIKRLDQLSGVPLGIIGAGGLYASMLIYGLVSFESETPNPKKSYLNIEVKGLS